MIQIQIRIYSKEGRLRVHQELLEGGDIEQGHQEVADKVLEAHKRFFAELAVGSSKEEVR